MWLLFKVSELCSRDFTDFDNFVSCYNATLTELIDKHTPEQRKCVTGIPKVPWVRNNLAKCKRERKKEMDRIKDRTR